MLKWPSAFNTLNVSLNAFVLSGTKFNTQLLTTTSIESPPIGICSMSPFLNSTLLKPSLSALILALFTISSVKSSPKTFPVSPVNSLAIKQSFPAPDPKSKTMSPSFICANSVGIPHPKLKSASSLYPFSFV